MRLPDHRRLLRMLRRGQRDQQVASLRRRFLASLINVTVVGLTSTVAVGAWVLVAGRVLDRREGTTRARPTGSDAGASNPARSRRVKTALRLLAVASWMPMRERRSPGYRMLHMRLVDARTGDQPTPWQQIIRTVASNSWRALSNRPLARRDVRNLADYEKMRSELDAARREHPDDEEARSVAFMRIYEANKAQVSFLPILARLGVAVAIELPVWSAEKQSLPDRLAGTIVIVDQKGGQPRRRRRALALRLGARSS